MSDIIFSVRLTIPMKVTCLSTIAPSDKAINIMKAAIAAFQAISSLAAPETTASTSRPEYSGVSTSASVENSTAVRRAASRTGCLFQCAQENRKTLRKARLRAVKRVNAIGFARWRERTGLKIWKT